MECLQEFKGVLIKFENAAQHAEFRQFKERTRIQCWLWSDEWKQNKQNVVVVNIRFEKQAFEFINICKN